MLRMTSISFLTVKSKFFQRDGRGRMSKIAKTFLNCDILFYRKYLSVFSTVELVFKNLILNACNSELSKAQL